MDANPYEVLGIERTATRAEIDAAFRQKSKTAHPDAGGSAEAFARLNEAAEILRDPDLRAHFDSTGQIKSKVPQNHADMAAHQIINQTIKSFLLAEQDMLTGDMVALMSNELNQAIAGMRKSQADFERAMSRAKRLRGRFKRKRATDRDLLDKMLQWHENMALEGIKNLKLAIEAHERAKEIIADHDFDPEVLVAYQGGFQQQTNASPTGGWNIFGNGPFG